MKRRLCRMSYNFTVWMASACILAALGAQTANAQAPAPDWQTYSYPADGFSASFPATPEESKQNVPTSAGTFELRGYTAESGQRRFSSACAIMALR